jgi:hypothetical protein
MGASCDVSSNADDHFPSSEKSEVQFGLTSDVTARRKLLNEQS